MALKKKPMAVVLTELGLTGWADCLAASTDAVSITIRDDEGQVIADQLVPNCINVTYTLDSTLVVITFEDNSQLFVLTPAWGDGDSTTVSYMTPPPLVNVTCSFSPTVASPE